MKSGAAENTRALRNNRYSGTEWAGARDPAPTGFQPGSGAGGVDDQHPRGEVGGVTDTNTSS